MEVLIKPKFLVLQTAFLGDAILTLPFIQALKTINPDAVIDVITIPADEPIFLSSPYVNKVFVLEKQGRQKGLLDTIRFARNFARQDYTRLYSLHRSFRSSLISWFTGIPERFGYANSIMSFVYKHRIKYRYDYHEVRRHLAFLDYEDCNINWKIKPEMRVTEEQLSEVETVLSPIAKKIKRIALAPGSVWQTKRYPEEYFLEIIKYFCNKDYNILLLGGANETGLCDRLTISDAVHNLAGRLSVVESKLAIESAEILVTNDSASTHIGMAADAKTLTLYCSTTPAIGFFPYNAKSAWLSYDEPGCKPCGIHGYKKCPLGHFNCAHGLPPEEVINKMESMLAT